MSGNLLERISAAAPASTTCFFPAAGALTRQQILQTASIDRAALLGRSVLIRTRTQLAAALALIELDGVARRLILCPPELPLHHLHEIGTLGEVDAIVSDEEEIGRQLPRAVSYVLSECSIPRASAETAHATEWILLTSGTTGRPKLVAHTLSTLTGAIKKPTQPDTPAVWGTFYDIRRYGGLQILLRALTCGGALILPGSEETTAEYLTRAGNQGIAYLSGTPSQWRRALMNGAQKSIRPLCVRLSGEIADQAILDKLSACFPEARLVHAFASTEAGVAFEVDDGREGFPARILEGENADVAVKVEDGSLRVRSDRNALCILGAARSLRDADGFVDTGDMVARRGDRFYFVGRKDGMINVGGNKVHPEEVESVIVRHPRVELARARLRRSSILGAIIEADVVLRGDPRTGVGDGADPQNDIIAFCRQRLDRHKVPAAIHIVPSLPLTPGGKMERGRA